MVRRYFSLIFTVFLFWTIFFPGIHIGHDFPNIYPEALKENISLPQVWSTRGSEGMGYYAVDTLWSWPLDFGIGLLSLIGLPFWVITLGVFIIPTFVIGCIGIHKLLEDFGIKGVGIFVGQLVFLANSYLALLIDGGQLSIALAYSLFPLAFYFLKEVMDKSSPNAPFKFALVVAFISISDIRFLYILAVLVSIKFIFDLVQKQRGKVILRYFKLGFITTSFLFFLHLYWLLPAIFARAPLLPSNYGRVTQLSFLNFTTLGHALFFITPHWFQNIFGQVTGVLFYFVIFPLLAFLPIFVIKKGKSVGFWTLIALSGVFLAKGVSPPLGTVYQWLFTNFPGFSLFRDSTKFFFMVGISYSVLAGFSVDWILSKVRTKTARICLFLSVLGIWSVLLYPAWSDKMTGLLRIPQSNIKIDYIKNISLNGEKYSRSLWMPFRHPFAFADHKHPLTEATLLVVKRPFSIGVVGTYELFNFLRDYPEVDEFLRISSIANLLYTKPISKSDSEYYEVFSDQLADLPWVSWSERKEDLLILKTREHEDLFFLTQEPWFVIGSDEIYGQVPKESFKQSSFIFLEEGLLDEKILTGDDARIVAYQKNLTDVAAFFLGRDYFLFPSRTLDFSPDGSGWWKRETGDFLTWRSFLESKYKIENTDFDYGGGWAVAEGATSRTVYNITKSCDCILIARFLLSSQGGILRFSVDGNEIGQVNTKLEKPSKVVRKLAGYKDTPDKFLEYDKGNVEWSEVGEVTSMGKLQIETRGNINVVNALGVIPKNLWDEAKRKAAAASVVLWDEISELDQKSLFEGKNSGEVDYTPVSPTHFKVRVTGLEDKSLLVFSQNFDPLWTMNDVGAYPVYSFVNGFMVAENGEYDVYFTPQKYVLPGLLFGWVGVLMVTFLVYKRLMRV